MYKLMSKAPKYGSGRERGKVVKLPRKEFQRLRKLAELEGATDDELVRRALAEYAPEQASEDELAVLVAEIRTALDDAVRSTKAAHNPGKASVDRLDDRRERDKE